MTSSMAQENCHCTHSCLVEFPVKADLLSSKTFIGRLEYGLVNSSFTHANILDNINYLTRLFKWHSLDYCNSYCRLGPTHAPHQYRNPNSQPWIVHCQNSILNTCCEHHILRIIIFAVMNVVEVGYDCYGPSFISSHASVVAELVTAERNVITLRVATVHCSDSAAILS